MDLNSDGRIDILSGSYSRMEGSMAGLFQVLYGQEGGGFQGAQVLTSDGEEPLVISDAAADDAEDGDPDVVRICTRPFAADLDGDGLLDVVSGNFDGTFAFFQGLEDGHFDPVASFLPGPDRGRLRVEAHSDPVLVDLDGDGDLDLVSGSTDGSVTLFPNVGDKEAPSFGKGKTLLAGLAPEQLYTDDVRFGDEHITRPQGSTRVSLADFNGDGKLDLLVGDSLQLHFPVEGLSHEDVRARLAEWDKELEEIMSSDSGDPWDGQGEPTAEQQAAMEAMGQKFSAHYEKRAEFLKEESTGSVWVMIQK